MALRNRQAPQKQLPGVKKERKKKEIQNDSSDSRISLFFYLSLHALPSFFFLYCFFSPLRLLATRAACLHHLFFFFASFDAAVVEEERESKAVPWKRRERRQRYSFLLLPPYKTKIHRTASLQNMQRCRELSEKKKRKHAERSQKVKGNSK